MSELSTLRWRSRRGMRELDVVLVRYLDQHYATATDQERDVFKALLELEDPRLYALVTGREVASNPEQAAMIAKLVTPPA